LSSIFVFVETGDSYIASEGYDIKKHRGNHRLLTNQRSIFCRHWLLKAAKVQMNIYSSVDYVTFRKLTPTVALTWSLASYY
jgi:hypothetical protein